MLRPKQLRMILCMAILLLQWTSFSLARLDPPFFPNRVFSEQREEHERFNKWYSKHLRAMNEPPLWPLDEQNGPRSVYRFLWLPAFYQPEVVRVVHDGDEAILHLVQLDGKGGYEPGKVALTKNVKLSQEQWDELSRWLSQLDFWELPTDHWKTSFDGAAIVIEGVEDGKYHVVHANLASEDQQDAFFRIVRMHEFLVELCGLEDPE